LCCIHDFIAEKISIQSQLFSPVKQRYDNLLQQKLSIPLLAGILEN
jgi:hypothetical protein